MNKKTLNISIVGIVLLVLLGWFYYTPFIAYDSLKKATERSDAKAVSEYVDFPSLRESVKSWVKASMINAMVKEMKDNPFAGLGLLMVNAMVDPMVDAMISPAGIAAMMEGQTPKPDENNGSEEQDGGGSSRAKDAADVTMGYTSFNQFEVTAKGGKDFEVAQIFRRYGFTWKLAEVRLPPLLSSGAREDYAPVTASDVFVVELAALSDATKAEVLKARAAKAGLPAFTDKAGNLTRVRVGPYPTRAAAVAAAVKLAENNMAGRIITE